MAANFWALHTLWHKFGANLILRWRTGLKVALEYEPADIAFFKTVSLGLSALLLLPVVLRLAKKQVGPREFCNILAVTNWVSFNFGFHVHEKAMLMVYLPLLLARKTPLDTLRLTLLGLVMTWTMLPLIPGRPAETTAKHLLLLW